MACAVDSQMPLEKLEWKCKGRRGYLPLMDVANAANMHFKLLILLSVDPFTRERRQVQFLSANQKATEHWALLKKLSAAIDYRYRPPLAN